MNFGRCRGGSSWLDELELDEEEDELLLRSFDGGAVSVVDRALRRWNASTHSVNTSSVT